MTQTPNFRPADRVTNPRLFAIARARWPSVPFTTAMLEEAAKLTGKFYMSRLPTKMSPPLPFRRTLVRFGNV